VTCQNAADVAAPVLPRLCGRIARPCDAGPCGRLRRCCATYLSKASLSSAHFSPYTSTSSGRSPAQSASPKHRSARLTAAISAALVTLWEFVASHKPRFGHAKPNLHSFVRIVPHKRLHACRSCPVSLPFASFVPSSVRDAIRVAILRRASFSLRSNFRHPCLACASHPVRRMALKSSHSARHGPQPARFLTQNGSLLHVSFATSGSCFHKKPKLRIQSGI
jgi:hypothetical protein